MKVILTPVNLSIFIWKIYYLSILTAIFSKIVRKMDNIMEVANGTIQVIFPPWIRISPGKFPNGIPVLEIRIIPPPTTVNIKPSMIRLRTIEIISNRN